MNSTQTFQIQKLPSSKLFFNKYVYKIEGRYPKAGQIVHQLRYNRISPNYKSDNFTQNMKTYIARNDIKVRVEGYIFGIYTNDTNLVDEIGQRLSPFIKNIYGPQSEKERAFLLNNSRRKIVRDQYPYKKYKFKINLKHWYPNEWPVENRTKFYEWLSKFNESQPGRSMMPKGTAFYLLGYRNWVSSASIYVSNEQDLSMILMYLGDKIKFVEEYVLRSDIATQV